MTVSATGRSVSEADLWAIEAAATDYIQSWLDGDPDRMRRCLHPDLAKRSLGGPGPDGEAVLDSQTADSLIEGTAAGRGKRHPRQIEVTVLDAYGDNASVLVRSVPYVEYLHIARFGRGWLIVNVLWQFRDTDAPPAG